MDPRESGGECGDTGPGVRSAPSGLRSEQTGGNLLRKLILITAAMLALALPAAAQDYPTRAITMIVPYPAGGPSDVVARIIADGMRRRPGEAVIIENVGGAGGTIGGARAAAADPDGYTLL